MQVAPNTQTQTVKSIMNVTPITSTLKNFSCPAVIHPKYFSSACVRVRACECERGVSACGHVHGRVSVVSALE